MKKITTLSLCAVTLSIALTGCGAKTETKPEASASSSSATSGLAVPDMPTGPHKTINDYVDENKIAETPVKKGDPGAPVIHFAMPPDWKSAGAKKPQWAYGAIVYDKAKNPEDPPFIIAIFSKLTGGGVQADKVLEYAPGLLENLPGYQQDGDVKKDKVGGFDAIKFQGSYLRDKERRYIAQRTIVIPKDDAVYVLQLNADAPLGQDDVIHDAAKEIAKGTTITA